MEQPDLFELDQTIAVNTAQVNRQSAVPPVADAPRPAADAPKPDPDSEVEVLKRELAAKEAECNELAWLSAMQSSAALGHVKPFHPYKGKPLAPVEEVLRLQRVIELMREGTSYEAAKTTAAAEIPIKYAGTR